MEGHGNKYLSKYFATAIAEEVGQEHLQTLETIIAQKYNQTDDVCDIQQDKKEECDK